jgi:transcriptional regulator with XRE-family HTH domain
MIQQSKIDKYVISKVRELREEKGWSQKELSIRMDFSEGFVGHVENPKRRDKYNLVHVNMLAKIFKCSPREFLPEKAV